MDLNIILSDVSKKKYPATFPKPPSGTDFFAKVFSMKYGFLRNPNSDKSLVVTSISNSFSVAR